MASNLSTFGSGSIPPRARDPHLGDRDQLAADPDLFGCVVAIPRLTRPAVTRSPARGDTSHNEREPSSPPGDQSLNDLGDDVAIGKASFEREKGRYRRQRNDPGQGLAARENSIR